MESININSNKSLDHSVGFSSIDWKQVKKTVIPATANCLAGAIVNYNNPSSYLVAYTAKKCFAYPWEAVKNFTCQKCMNAVDQYFPDSKKNAELIGGLASVILNIGAPFAVGYRASQYYGNGINLAPWLLGSIFGAAVQFKVALHFEDDPFIDCGLTSITHENFQKEVIESDLPVVIDVYGTWCPPCRAFVPTFLEASKQFVGKVKFVKFNMDESSELASKLNIQVVPTFFYYKDGELLDKQVGRPPKDQFFNKIETLTS